MTYPWAAGETLTAADLNSYAGLVFIKSQTIGSSVSSVTLSSVFSSSFENYKVVVAGVSSSTDLTLQVAFGGSSGHFSALSWLRYDGASGTILVNDGAAIAVCYIVPATGNCGAEFHVNRPNVSSYTEISGTGNGKGVSFFQGGTDFNVRSHTDLTLTTSTGTMSGGTVRVYGYNNG